MKIKKLIVVVIAIAFIKTGFGQIYTPSNAHSHNDYENPSPFFTAYYKGFGSIEADVFDFNVSLSVGYTFSDIQKKRTLQAFYLDPSQNKINATHGYPYADSTHSLQ